MIEGTLDENAAQDICWDAIVVGAGPAGTVAALELARRKLRTLLLDRKRFPRDKVCGGCLNAEATERLQALGLRNQLESLHAPALRCLALWASKRRLAIDLPGGMAVSRDRLDAALIEAAIASGAEFLPGTDVQIGEPDLTKELRRLKGRQGDNSFQLSARTVVMATGLAGEPISFETGLRSCQSRGARIGLHTFTTDSQRILVPGMIYMGVGRHGYVGLTVVEEHRVNVAAAVDVAALRQSNAEVVCRQILVESGLPLADTLLSGTQWQGTVGLTRWRRRRAAERLFVIGDAAGYVEPFTGEGMAAAIRSGQAVGSFVEKAVQGWEPQLIEQWDRASNRLAARRQTICRGLAQILRNPYLVRSAMEVACRVPAVGPTIVKMIN